MLTFETRRTKIEWQEIAKSFCRKEREIQELYDGLFSLSPKQVRQQYAGYVLRHVHLRCPALLAPKLKDLLTLLEPGARIHPSIPRQLFSIFQDHELPEDLAGEVFAKAVHHFLDMQQPIAARARALETSAKVASQYEGLWPEVYELADNIQPQDSAGIRSIGNRVLKQARREMAKLSGEGQP